MRSSIHAASLLALALTVSPIAFAGDAGEKHSCCKKDAEKCDKKEAAKCDPKTCPPGKCEKHAATATKAKTTDAKPVAKPAA